MEITIEEVVMDAWIDKGKPESQRRKVRPNLWRVRVDKMHAGFIERADDGISDRAKLMMHLRFPEDELALIEQTVSEHFGRPVGAMQPSAMPEETKEVEDDVLDDLETD